MFLGIKHIERFLKCSDVYHPNGGFGSQVASNYPVVVDDHDLVLKPMVLGYPDGNLQIWPPRASGHAKGLAV